MLNCPFCGQDYSDVGLREGRCPFCGGVLAWEEETESGPVTPVPQPPLDQPAEASESEATSPGESEVSGQSDARLPAWTDERVDDGPAPPRGSGRPRPLSPPPGIDSTYLPPPSGYGETDRAAGTAGGRESEEDLPPPPAPESFGDEDVPQEDVPEDDAERDRTETPADLVARTIDQRVLTDSELARMTAMWQKSVSEQSSPRMTLKSDVRSETITESRLVIQPHALKDLGEKEPPDGNRPDYELLAVIGEGGVGVVYSARQASIDRTVAVKMLRPEIMNDELHQQKFLSEAVVTGDLDHPNIVPIYDLGSNQSGALFYSMKRVQGTPWSDVIRRNSQPQNIEILMKVADAIAFAHSRGVIHRDLKPENVMLGEFGEVLVMDWGIALSTSVFLKQGSISKSSSMGGTPAYMAPEMAVGPVDAIGAHSDVYLLGGILYEILTGRTPHYGESVTACLESAAKNRIPPTKQTGELMEIALRALATDPADRFPSVQAFQAAVRTYQSHSESVLLSTRAEDELKTADRSGDYQDYARAMFAFEEAFDLWNGNDRARRGMNKARLAYAQHALKQEDYDLGISLLQPGEPSHARLLNRLKSGRARRNAQQRRVQQFRAIAAGLVVVIIAGGTVALYRITQDRNELAATSRELARQSAERSNQVAIANYRREMAVEAETRASENADAARRARRLAEQNAQQARDLGNEALEEGNKSQRSAYRAELVAAGVRIEEGQEARETLVEMSPKLRHVEWGRLRFLAERLAAIQPVPAPVEAVDVSPDGRYVVAGCENGSAYVVDFGDPADDSARSSSHDRFWELKHCGPIHAVAIHPTTLEVAVAGGNEAGNNEAGGRGPSAEAAPADWAAGGAGQRGAPGEGMVSIWNLRQLLAGKPAEAARVVRLKLHEKPILSIAFSRSDPPRLLTASRDGTARISSYRDPARSAGSETLFQGHRDAVRQASFSSDEKWVVTASDDGTVRIWQAALGDELQRYQGHSGPVHAAVFAPGSQPPRVASAGADGLIRIWTANVNKVLEIAEDLRSEGGEGIEANPRGVFVASLLEDAASQIGGTAPHGENIRSRLADVPLDEVVLERHQSSIWSLAFSPDGRLLVSTGSDSTIRIWDPAWQPDLSLPDETPGLLGELRRAARARFRRQDSGKPAGDWLRSLRGHGSAVKSARFIQAAGPESAARSLAVVSGSYDATVRRWNLAESRRQYEYLAAEQALTDVAITEDRRHLVGSAEDGMTYVFDVDQPASPTRLTEGHSWLANKAFFYRVAGEPRLLTAAGDGTVRVWNANTNTQIDWQDGTGSRGLLAISRDGKLFATGTSRHTVQIRDARTLMLVCELLGDYVQRRRAQLEATAPSATEAQRESMLPQVTTVAFSPDGEQVFIGDKDGMCHLMTIADAEHAIPPFQGHGEAINGAVFTPWGDVLTASGDGNVIQWNPASGERVGTAWSHTLEIQAADRAVTQTAPVKQLGVYVEAADRVHVVTAAPGELVIDAQGTPRPNRTRLRRRVLTPGRSIGEVERTTTVVMEADRINSLTFAPAGPQAFDVLLACSLESREGADAPDYLRLWTLPTAADGSGAPRVQPVWDDSLDRGAMGWAVFTDNGDAILTVGGRGARLWTRNLGRRITSYRPHAALHAVDLAPAGTFLETNSGGGDLGRLRWAAPREEAAADEFFVLTAGVDNSAKIWHCRAAGEESGGEESGGITSRAIARFDWGAAAERARRGHTAPINSARFFVDQGELKVVTAGDDGAAKIWQQVPETGLWRVTRSFAGPRGHDGPINAAQVSPDGKLLATAGDDRQVLLWKIPAAEEPDPPEPFGRLTRHRDAVNCLAFSPDCRWLATGSSDSTVLVWNLKPPAGQAEEPDEERAEPPGEQPMTAPEAAEAFPLVGTIVGHSAAVRSVVFSPDGHRIVTGSEDTSIRVWDTYGLWFSAEDQRLNELLKLNEHTRGVNAVRFTADGRDLVSASGDGRAILWPGDFVDPSIRLSDQATRFKAPGSWVDERLMVMEPTDMDRSAWDYEVVVSIESQPEREASDDDRAASDDSPGAPEAANPGSLPAPADGAKANGAKAMVAHPGERLELVARDGVLEIAGGQPGSPARILCFDPVSGSLEPVATMKQTDGKIELQLLEEADNRSLQTILRRLRYRLEAADADLTRFIRFELRARQGSRVKTLMTDTKLINITSFGSPAAPSSGSPPVGAALPGAAGIHHFFPASLNPADAAAPDPAEAKF